MIEEEIPSIFARYHKKISNNNILSPIGRNGIVHIELDITEDSRTFLKNVKSRAPLLVQRALYPDRQFPKMAKIYLMSSSGGILQGDRLKIDIIAHEKTSALFTTQAATKIYKMEYGYAHQNINIHLHKGSYVEFTPEQIIPYTSSRFYQEVNLRIEPNSSVLYSEILSAGRIASGEVFDFDICFFKINAYDENDNIIFADTMSIEPAEYMKYIQYAFGHKKILSNIYIVTKTINYKELDQRINSIINSQPILGGCSALPQEAGIVTRILSNSVDEAKWFIKSVVFIVRNFILN
jgi:urease accessory protein